MRKITFKIGVGILAFTIGTIATAICLINTYSFNQTLEIAPPANIENEITEEYAVYSAVINELYLKEDSTRMLVISNQTSFYGDGWHKAMYGDNYIKNYTTEQRVGHLKENYPSVNEETLFDYDSKMLKPHKLHSNFNFSIAYDLTNKDSYEKDRVIRLSKVGFNKERNQGFVYIESKCEAMCGRSDYLLLEKVNGIWTVKEIYAGLRS